MSSMNSYLQIPGCGLLVLLAAVQAQGACPAGTLWEPYLEVCADVRDVQGEFLPAPETGTALLNDAPVPGTMTAGTAYAPDQLVALDSGRLHTRMFVYPNDLERDGPLPGWLYTTATSRVDNGLEVVAMYAEHRDTAYLGLFSWTCVPDFPCPDAAMAPSWQWSRPLPELTCNITQIVDQGGHAQKQLYYANHSDRLDDGSPSLWKSAVYLWNYCDAAWDLAWTHEYRQDKLDCSVPGATCAWWGPSVEIFGDAMYPQIGELGYEDSLLYHDGTWSQLLPPEAQFRDPADPAWGSLTPWQLFHLEPNRSYGVGNWFNVNDAPVIEHQAALSTEAGQSLTIDTSLLTISDADIDPAYHVDYRLTVYAGNNYTYSNGELTPDAGFTGTLVVPISVNDGAAESATFELLISVGQVNVPPSITGQHLLQTFERTPIEITVGDVLLADPDNELAELSIRVLDGAGYQRAGNTVTPEPGIIGTLVVMIVANDGELDSDIFELLVQVIADNVPPEIVLNGPATVSVRLGSPYTDAGASATDNVDGDISDRIEVDNPVNTDRSETYVVTYRVVDIAGNVAVATRTVIVDAATPISGSSGGGGAFSIGILAALVTWARCRIALKYLLSHQHFQCVNRRNVSTSDQHALIAYVVRQERVR